MAKEKNKDNNSRIQLALAATMFFSPFVKHVLKRWHLDIDENDKKFIEWYVRLGYITLGILILTIASMVAVYLMPNIIFGWIRTISVIIMIALLVFGTIGVLANISILQGEGKFFETYETKTNKGDILFSFIPLYNIYLWYKLHKFEAPYWRAKESILWRTLFLLVILASKSMVLSSFVLTVIIIRVASLMSGIDVFDKVIKKYLNNLFLKNPEEMRWYILGLFKYVYYKLVGNLNNQTLKSFVIESKESYSKLLGFKNTNIGLQYFIWIGLLVGWLSLWATVLHSRIHYIPVALILGRYILMSIKWKHLPPLPVAKEISDGLIWLWRKIHPAK